MVTVKMSGDLQLQEVADRPRGGRPRGRGDARRHGPRRGQRGAAHGPGARRAQARRGDRGARPRRPRRAWACRGCERASYAPPVQQARDRALKAARASATARPSGSPSTSCAPPPRTPPRSPRRSREVKERIRLCEVCFNLTDEARCRICQDPRRDQALICVVEEPSDVIPMERTHEYHGVYHVLGGALSPIDGVDPEDLKIARAARARGSGRRRRRCAKWCSPPTPPRPARRPRCTSPRSCARACSRANGHAPGQRPAGRLGPRVRRRGHARQGLRWPATRRARAPRCRGPYPAARVGTIVMKFGGTSVADAERIKRAARRIVEKRERRALGGRGALGAGQDDRRADRDGRGGLRPTPTRARWTCCCPPASASPARCARWRSTISATGRSR